MSSSRKSTDRNDATDPLLVAEGGAAYQPLRSNDPLADWMELMEAVEALCPRWPVRALRARARGFRL